MSSRFASEASQTRGAPRHAQKSAPDIWSHLWKVITLDRMSFCIWCILNHVDCSLPYPNQVARKMYLTLMLYQAKHEL